MRQASARLPQAARAGVAEPARGARQRYISLWLVRAPEPIRCLHAPPSPIAEGETERVKTRVQTPAAGFHGPDSPLPPRPSRRWMSRVLGACLCLAVLPAPAMAQGFSIAARAGTTGVGPEASFRAGSVVFRGSYGLLPITFNATRYFDIDGVERARIELPSNWFTIGADVVLGGFFRIGAGVLHKPGDFKTTVVFKSDTMVVLGGEPYSPSVVTALKGAYSSRSTAPFALIGFGAGAPGGFGFFIDLGVAFVGDASLGFDAEGDRAVIETQEFRDALDREERRVEDRAGKYLKYWPVVNVGLRFGFG